MLGSPVPGAKISHSFTFGENSNLPRVLQVILFDTQGISSKLPSTASPLKLNNSYGFEFDPHFLIRINFETRKFTVQAR